MVVIMKPKVIRSTDLQPGDLFVFEHPGGSSIALRVTDPTNYDHLLLAMVIGPSFPSETTRPTLYVVPESAVVSFGKGYAIRLPSRVQGWRTNQPSEAEDSDFIVITDQGGVFLRANLRNSKHFTPGYVDLSTGKIECDKNKRAYVAPPGISAFALEWEFLTNDEKPRPIFSYPTGRAFS
jgi:hypothetical protein